MLKKIGIRVALVLLLALGSLYMVNQSSSHSASKDTSFIGRLKDTFFPPPHDMYAAPPYATESVANNGRPGWSTKQKVGYSLNEIPEEYRAAITVPEFNPAQLAKSPYEKTKYKGQCTELTWAYLNQLWSEKFHSRADGGEMYLSYGEAGGYVTDNPTVGYGFSVPGNVTGTKMGHTGVVIAVYPDGSFLTANYNMEAVDAQKENGKRTLSYILFPGAQGFKFFSGLGEPTFKA